ncbi:phage major tail tube protein [Vibrio parahaemolyticus]|uniref:phage major tail tube protein n=1 Tax=Vibrio parahaemolyticus TaxID=670 RepID=UPI001D16B4A7|nr:phage major tail tube protein [Vibrio parahaemolyticus]MCC3798268.1 phage major tail tube protein [Vibrio parahaemolyticus]
MSARIPSVLVDFNAFLKNESFAGLANKLTLPKIVTKTIDFDGAGIGGTMKRDVGKLEAMESEVTISNYSDKVLGLVGSRSSRDEQFVVKGALDIGGQIKSVVVRQQGYWRELEFNPWDAGGVEATNKFVIDVEFFELEVDGKRIFTIDKLNNDFIGPDGKNRNDEIKKALGQ